MEDMHIHLKEALYNEDLFYKYIEKSLECKLDKVVFLEHGNRISKKHNGLLDNFNNIDSFNNILNDYQKKNYCGKIKIIKGIEIDFSEELEFREETKKILTYGKFEWVLGAIHSLKFDSLKEYLETVLKLIKNYEINAIAHLKLDETYKDYEYLINDLLILCSKKNICIEINTSDRSRWSDEQLFFMLELMKKNNVNYVIGSDAHSIDEIGYMIEDTVKKVKKWRMEK